MTPLEIAAKSYWQAESLRGLPWEQAPEDIRERIMRRMSAALLALAEADISKEMIAIGFEDNAQGWEDDFAKLLRAIAEGNK